MKDIYQRKIDYLRLSLTDRCQLRCHYCMPDEGVEWTPLDQLLSFAEIKSIVQTFAELGVSKLKLTGGEPLLRPNIVTLISELKAIKGIEEVTLTTNGVQLAEMIDELVEAGLDGVNISLDTLDENRYTLLTRRNKLDAVLTGLERAIKSKIKQVKINCVLAEEINKDEILAIAQLAKNSRVHVRFIEYMPIGAPKPLTPISEEYVRQLLSQHYGPVKPYDIKLGNGPARYDEIAGFQGKIGFISAVSHHFCDTCNRVRITSDGFLKTCLYFNKGVDIKSAIKAGNLQECILEALQQKPKQHRFSSNDEYGSREKKSMVQIGG